MEKERPLKKTTIRILGAALLLLGSVTVTADFCQEQPDIMCGYRCSSNSCINDSISRPDDGCWLDYSNIPVMCSWDPEHSCCGSGPGL